MVQQQRGHRHDRQQRGHLHGKVNGCSYRRSLLDAGPAHRHLDCSSRHEGAQAAAAEAMCRLHLRGGEWWHITSELPRMGRAWEHTSVPWPERVLNAWIFICITSVTITATTTSTVNGSLTSSRWRGCDAKPDTDCRAGLPCEIRWMQSTTQMVQRQ